MKIWNGTSEVRNDDETHIWRPENEDATRTFKDASQRPWFLRALQSLDYSPEFEFAEINTR